MFISFFCGLLIFSSSFMVHANELPNGGFELGKTQEGIFLPSGWNRSGESGDAVTPGYQSKRALSIRGDGKTSSAWTSSPIQLESGKQYELSFWGKAAEGTTSGLAITGPAEINHDFTFSQDWKKYSFVFRASSEDPRTAIRFGQWQVNGTLLFDSAVLLPVHPVYKQENGLVLGQGETVQNRHYEAVHRMNAGNTTACRFLQTHTARFNTHRWTIGSGDEVVYRHSLPKNPIQDAAVEVRMNYYTGGQCIVSARNPASEWVQIGSFDRLSTQIFSIPKTLFPAESMEIRIAGNDDCNFQIDGYRFAASLYNPSPPIIGETHYIKEFRTNPSLSVSVLDIGQPRPGIQQSLKMSLENRSGKSQTYRVNIGIDTTPKPLTSKKYDLEANEERIVNIPYTIGQSGEQLLSVTILSENKKTVYQSEIPLSVSYLYDANFGHLLSGNNSASVWWCPAAYKVSRSRPAPKNKSHSIELSAARGEFEPVQVIVWPNEPVKQLRVHCGDLVHSKNIRIPAGQISVKQVLYVPVAHPSDAWGCEGLWPDPLPVLDNPITLNAGENQPFWITVQVPRNAEPGIYKGQIHFTSDSWSETVTLRLNVYDFEIPKEFHLKTAFGFSTGNVKRYHHLDTQEELDQVTDLYFQNFRDHRISPYNPTLLHPIRAELRDDFVFDFQDFEKAGERYFDDFGFTGMRLHLQGLGGGTFHSRYKGKIGAFEQGTPEHERLFKQYASTIENFLQKKGWLDKAYIYWFDEPAPRDYEFVREGMDLIHRSAPGLKRMLTEQPENGLFDAVDIWCPILDAYDPEICHLRQQEGDEIWWYICTGPKEPYPGLFIDHPAIDLRIWLWMTHKYNVEGCLVWQSNYWTSGIAFPEPNVQDPYDDPMGYVSGYGRPVGFKGFWGNGDGRFIYPPAEWNDTKKKICGPVDSIRWEMLREGIEDFEYFYLLKTLLKNNQLKPKQKREAIKLLEIPEQILTSRTNYAKDPQPLYQHRDKIARFLEKALQAK